MDSSSTLPFVGAKGGACRFLLDPVAKLLVADAELFSHLGDGGTFGSGHGH